MDDRITSAMRLRAELGKVQRLAERGLPIHALWAERYCVGADGDWTRAAGAFRRLVQEVLAGLIGGGDGDVKLVAMIERGPRALVDPANFGLDAAEFVEKFVDTHSIEAALTVLHRLMILEGNYQPFDPRNVETCVAQIKEHMGAIGCGTSAIAGFIVENLGEIMYVIEHWSLFGVSAVQDTLAYVDQRFADKIGQAHQLTEIERQQFLAAARIVELVSRSLLFGYRDCSAVRAAAERRLSTERYVGS